MYDEKLYRIYNIILNTEKLYDKQTQKEYLIDDFKLESKVVRDLGRLSEYEITHYYLNQAFYKFPSFRYRYNGIFLSGDEGAGFNLNTKSTLHCVNGIIKRR